MVFIREVGFVWRQLELAFFGAVTSVAALFNLKGISMEENILIEGKFKKATKLFFIFSIILSVLGLLYIVSSVVLEMYWFLIGTAVFELMALAFFLIAKFVMPKAKTFELIITDRRVIGKLRNNRVDLPVSKISSIGTLAFKGISITTDSGKIAFPQLINRDEVYDCLAKLFNTQHELNTNVKKSSGGITEELTELKNLLDSGIITEEEFDAKKKQLLGL